MWTFESKFHGNPPGGCWDVITETSNVTDWQMNISVPGAASISVAWIRYEIWESSLKLVLTPVIHSILILRYSHPCIIILLRAVIWRTTLQRQIINKMRPSVLSSIHNVQGVISVRCLFLLPGHYVTYTMCLIKSRGRLLSSPRTISTDLLHCN